MGRIKNLFCIGVVGALLAFGVPANAETLLVTEHQITSSSLEETTPTLGNDGVSDLVVYTVFDASGSGDIYYQRLAADGAPSGSPVFVSSATTDDELNDVYGDYIVYTAYESSSTFAGSVVLYEISGSQQWTLSSGDYIREAHIAGTIVVWREGSPFTERVLFYDLSWLNTPQEPIPLTGPDPPAFDVEVGDSFVVWSEAVSEQFEIVAYDLTDPAYLPITNSALVEDTQPVTAGAWIVWQAVDEETSEVRILAHNVDTSDARVVADTGSLSRLPSVDGDLVSYEVITSPANLDVFLYVLSLDESFQVTSDPEQEHHNDVFGDLVAWADAATGNGDIYVAKLQFVPDGTVPDIILLDLIPYIEGLDPNDDFAHRKHQNTLVNKLELVLFNVEADDHALLCEAIDQLNDDILVKVGGGRPRNAWVTDADARAWLTTKVLEVISILEVQAAALGGCPAPVLP